MVKVELEERDKLIAEKGLVIVGEDVPDEEGVHKGDNNLNNCNNTPKRALVSVENAQLLESVGGGNLGELFLIKNCLLLNSHASRKSQYRRRGDSYDTTSI